VNLRSLTGRPLRAFTYYDPSLTREGNDDTAATVGDALVASDGSAHDDLPELPLLDAAHVFRSPDCASLSCTAVR
jgi:hypothetical protein